MTSSSLRSLKPADFDFWKAHHLLNRAGFGATPSQVRAIHAMGLRGAVDYIVDFEDHRDLPVDDDRFDSDIMRPLTPDERQAQRRARQSGDEAALEQFRRERQQRQGLDRQQLRDMQAWWLERMVRTARPLEEKMTLFWHGHFATGYRAIEDSYHMLMQNQMFRRNAVGNFGALARGIIRDPAMLEYLNNNQNRRQQPNENLARELMELFTMGEGNIYTEDDIKQGARALTGYTFQDDEFIFRERMHDSGAKNILGKIGPWDGDDFVDIILTKRVVSEYMCWKLYRYFVNDLPGTPDKATQQFIVRLAKQMRDTKYELRPVLKTLFRSEHFYDDRNVASLVKNPIQLMVQAIRTLGTPPRNYRTLIQVADRMGQHLFMPPSVKGWDGGRAWINTSTLFTRQNAMVMLLTGQPLDGRQRRNRRENTSIEPYDPMHLIAHLEAASGSADVADVVPYLLRFLMGRTPHESRIATCHEFMQTHDNRITPATLTGLLLLMTAMPEYQLC
ncbi:MAG: DUF1800 domain-containing protein [Planctomycetota bacterium]